METKELNNICTWHIEYIRGGHVCWHTDCGMSVGNDEQMRLFNYCPFCSKLIDFDCKGITIGKNTCFELIDVERIEKLKRESYLILCGWKLFINQNYDDLMLNNSFGRGFSSVSFRFNTKEKRLEVMCTSDFDMTWLLFSEDDINDIDDNDDRYCAQFTIYYINLLRCNGIIGKQLSV